MKSALNASADEKKQKTGPHREIAARFMVSTLRFWVRSTLFEFVGMPSRRPARDSTCHSLELGTLHPASRRARSAQS